MAGERRKMSVPCEAPQTRMMFKPGTRDNISDTIKVKNSLSMIMMILRPLIECKLDGHSIDVPTTYLSIIRSRDETPRAWALDNVRHNIAVRPQSMLYLVSETP